MSEFKPIKTASKNEKIVISIRLDVEKLEQIDSIAHQTDISRNELILQCIDFAISNMPNEK